MVYDLDIVFEDMVVWDLIKDELVVEFEYKNVKVILWKGYCFVYEKFIVKNI